VVRTNQALLDKLPCRDHRQSAGWFRANSLAPEQADALENLVLFYTHCRAVRLIDRLQNSTGLADRRIGADALGHRRLRFSVTLGDGLATLERANDRRGLAGLGRYHPRQSIDPAKAL